MGVTKISTSSDKVAISLMTWVVICHGLTREYSDTWKRQTKSPPGSLEFLQEILTNNHVSKISLLWFLAWARSRRHDGTEKETCKWMLVKNEDVIIGCKLSCCESMRIKIINGSFVIKISQCIERSFSVQWLPRITWSDMNSFECSRWIVKKFRKF